MPDPILGNIALQMRAGLVTRLAPCLAALSGLAFASDGMCGYATIAALEASGKYASWDGIDLSFCTDDPWNGQQAIKIVSQGLGHATDGLWVQPLASGYTDLWARMIVRVAPATVGTIHYDLGELFMDFGAQGAGFILDGTGSPLAGHLSLFGFFDDGSPSTDLGAIPLDDGAWWELIIHMVRATGPDTLTATAYVRHADGSGTLYTGSVSGTWSSLSQWDWTLGVGPEAPGYECLGGWEVVDGTAHADPFAVLP